MYILYIIHVYMYKPWFVCVYIYTIYVHPPRETRRHSAHITSRLHLGAMEEVADEGVLSDPVQSRRLRMCLWILGISWSI